MPSLKICGRLPGPKHPDVDEESESTNYAGYFRVYPRLSRESRPPKITNSQSQLKSFSCVILRSPSTHTRNDTQGDTSENGVEDGLRCPPLPNSPPNRVAEAHFATRTQNCCEYDGTAMYSDTNRYHMIATNTKQQSSFTATYSIRWYMIPPSTAYIDEMP